MKKIAKFIIYVLILTSCVSEYKNDLTQDMRGKWRLYVVFFVNNQGINDQVNYFEDDNIIFDFVDDKRLFVNKNSILLNAGEYNYSMEYDFITYTIESGWREKLLVLNNAKYQIRNSSTTGDKEFRDFNPSGFKFYLRKID